MNRILITGGAGFIGSNIARKLLLEDYQITIYDNFSPQIHGKSHELPADLTNKVELIVGDVTDKKHFHRALDKKDAVIHLAAETGTGQSMYNIGNYTNVNILGTAHLCDYIINEENEIKTVIVASSRAIYGEGKYNSPEHGDVYPESRTSETNQNDFEVICPVSGKKNLSLRPTDEDSKIHPSSIYGITKQVQEQMVIMTCKLMNINGFALRYQNVFGPGQSLKNPYTGILSIFSRLAIQNEPLNVFEDGEESRDFIYIDDVVEATIKCLKRSGQLILNVGSGKRTTVMQVATEIVSYLKSNSEIKVSGSFREGDIRHNYADISRLQNELDFNPSWDFKSGLHKFLDWALQQQDIPKSNDDYTRSIEELKSRGLFKN